MSDIEVDPEVLRHSAPRIFEAAREVADAAALIKHAQVPSEALGTVEGADEFARAVDRFTELHCEDLEHGSVWVDDAGEGLKESADAFQRTEDNHVSTIKKLWSE